MYYGSTRGLFALVSRKTILLSVLLKSDLCITFSFPQKAMLISKRNIFSLCFLLFQHNLQVGFISLMFHVVKKLENVSAQLLQALQFIHALFHAANVIWCMNIKTGFKSWRIQQYASAQFRSKSAGRVHSCVLHWNFTNTTIIWSLWSPADLSILHKGHHMAQTFTR